MKRSFNLDGFQYEFTVLDEDRKGVSHYDQTKFYFWFKSQRVLSTQGASSGQLLNGKFQVFYSSKQLFEKGVFHKGLKHGKWRYWRSDGTLIRSEKWKDGVLRGKTFLYNSRGKLIETRNYFKRSFKRATSDSIICERNDGSKRTIWLKDSTGRVIEKQVFKNGYKVADRTKEKAATSSKKDGDATTKKGEKSTDSKNVKDKKTSDHPAESSSWFKRLFKKKHTKEATGESVQQDPTPTKASTEKTTDSTKRKWWRAIFSKKEKSTKQSTDKQ